MRGWPGRYPILLDAIQPGTAVDEGPMQIQTFALRAAEPLWRSGAQPVMAIGVRVHIADTTVVWVPGTAPCRAVTRATRDADLAILEIGVTPWPRTTERHRMSLTDALQISEARALWVVGDDGRMATGGQC
jgi:hypothetical protein